MSNNKQLLPITGLRGVLALWVVVFHVIVGFIFSHYPVAEHFTQPITNIFLSGYISVDAFFILSGFILSYVHANDFKTHTNKKLSLRFYALRLSRLYPVHITILLIYLIIKLNGIHFIVESCNNPLIPSNRPCDRFTTRSFVEQIFLVSSWGWNIRPTWNSPAWSISSEWFMYLLFPFLIPFIHRTSSSTKNIVVGIFSSLGIMLLILWQFDMLYSHTLKDETGLVRVICCFICGCFMYQFYQTSLYKKLPWKTLSWVSTLLILAICTSNYLWLTIPILPILLLSLSQREGIIPRFLSKRTMQWLGKISFSLYMSHLLVMELVGLIMNDPSTPPAAMSLIEGLGILGFLIFASIASATLLYYVVEEPARKFLRSRIERRWGYDS